MDEVNSLLMTNYKKVYNKNINNTNNIIKNVIKGIPTYTPNSIYTPDNLNNFSKSNITSKLKKIDKLNNNFIIGENHEINCSDFLSNKKSELDGIVSSDIQKSNNNTNIYEFSKTMSKLLEKIKLNNISD